VLYIGNICPKSVKGHVFPVHRTPLLTWGIYSPHIAHTCPSTDLGHIFPVHRNYIFYNFEDIHLTLKRTHQINIINMSWFSLWHESWTCHIIKKKLIFLSTRFGFRFDMLLVVCQRSWLSTITVTPSDSDYTNRSASQAPTGTFLFLITKTSNKKLWKRYCWRNMVCLKEVGYNHGQEAGTQKKRGHIGKHLHGKIARKSRNSRRVSSGV